MIPREIIYNSIRQEILDQKKCQFQLIGASITVTVAVLAYAAATNVGPMVYVAAVVMNVLSLTIILDKAISIQRMVGYLQLMESRKDATIWRWEYHLNIYRGIEGKSMEPEPGRKHKYVTTISLILILLTWLCTYLYFCGPEMLTVKQTVDFRSDFNVHKIFMGIVILMNIGILIISNWRRKQLVSGKYTSKAIRARWKIAIKEAEDELGQ